MSTCRTSIRLAAIVALCSAGAALAACGGGTPFGPTLGSTGLGLSTVSTVELSPDTIRFTDVAQTSQLTATALDTAGTTLPNAAFTWSSSDLTVATVSTSGLVTSVGAGAATISAKSGSVTGTAFVSVTTP